MLRLIEALGDRIYAHVILGEDGPLVARLQALGIDTEVLPLPERARVERSRARPGLVALLAVAPSLRYSLRIRRRLRQLRPDLVHANTLKGAVVGGVASRLARIPMVWHVRDRLSVETFSPAAVVAVRLLMSVLPTAVIGNSASTLALVPSRCRIRVVIPSLVRPSTARPQVRESVSVVGMVGRIAPWKGQDVFVRAFGEAFAEDSGVHAVVVGAPLFSEQGYEAGLRALVAKLGLNGRVQLLGHRDDIAAELEAIDVFVHASVEPEPFGQVIVEAMAAGVPVIATDAGGPRDIITNGADGLLTPPGDVDALARALRQLAQDPSLRRRLSDAGLVRSRAFAPELVTEAILDVYARCLAAS